MTNFQKKLGRSVVNVSLILQVLNQRLAKGLYSIDGIDGIDKNDVVVVEMVGGYKLGMLGRVGEENGIRYVSLRTDFEDEAPQVVEAPEAPDVPVFYQIVEPVFADDEPVVEAVLVSERALEQIFNKGYWRLTLERYSKENKDVLNIEVQDDGTFTVEKYTITYDGIAWVDHYSYETDNLEIIAYEIREAIQSGFELVFPEEFSF